MIIGKFSRLPSADIFLEELGMGVESSVEKSDILARVKEAALEKARLLKIEEFRQIVKEVTDK